MRVAQVLVMTPQILLNVLRVAFVNLGVVHLLVLDECHHAHAQHPYAQIMRVGWRRGGDGEGCESFWVFAVLWSRSSTTQRSF